MMIARIVLAAAYALLATGSAANAWDGTNTNTGASVEIEQGQLVRSGETIDVYDSNEGYKSYDIDNITRYGSTVEIEATDSATGESTTLEMDDN
jgi:hypothetical protein